MGKMIGLLVAAATALLLIGCGGSAVSRLPADAQNYAVNPSSAATTAAGPTPISLYRLTVVSAPDGRDCYILRYNPAALDELERYQGVHLRVLGFSCGGGGTWDGSQVR